MSSSTATALPTFKDILDLAMATYREHFGQEPELACCAPGRVNLIGEHLDYNDGFVLPMALPMVTLLVGGRRPGDEAEIITCCSNADAPKRVKFGLSDLQPAKPKWANYIKGVMHCYAEQRLKDEGVALQQAFNAVVVSNVPVGSGLSSSASFEVATLTFLEQLTGKPVESDGQRALICQAAEHKFVGMPCGIMDQMISVTGQEERVLLLDCRSLETFQIPFAAAAKDVVVLICNSDVRHELSNSEYPTRRKQCTRALDVMGLKSYRDATEAHLEVLQQRATRMTAAGDEALEADALVRRARHVITEIKRTQEAAEALRRHDFVKMGELMTQSHASLRDDFEVSCHEIDVLVDAAINCAGVLGSRMTGGGFGGCTVTLLQRAAVDNVAARMRESFAGVFNKNASERIEFYICTPAAGARRVNL